MLLTSPNFANGSELPFECSYEARNASPALSWTGAPLGVRSYALVCRDESDPRNWVHWLLWNLPSYETRLPAGLPPYPGLDDGAEQGLNDFLEYGWGGPCPLRGVHRYRFTLYAVSSTVRPASPTWAALSEELSGRTLAQADLVATYGSEGRATGLSLVGIVSSDSASRVAALQGEPQPRSA